MLHNDMATPIPISALFDPESAQWGLRGDPYLWREMRQRLASVGCPETARELLAIIEAVFEELTGHPISHTEFIHVEKYSHGGMSSGMISPGFWRDTAIPLLRQRYSTTASGRVAGGDDGSAQ